MEQPSSIQDLHFLAFLAFMALAGAAFFAAARIALATMGNLLMSLWANQLCNEFVDLALDTTRAALERAAEEVWSVLTPTLDG